MSIWLQILLIVFGALILAILSLRLLQPWMNRWGATGAESNAVFPGDELLAQPVRFFNRVISIQAGADKIFPWLVQLGADKGGFYSYTTIEKLINCPIVNADRIHPEWQNLKVGDLVRMCVNEPAPPPYIVAQILPNRALILGHKDGEKWVDVWQFVIQPQSAAASRLVIRTRTMMSGGFWEVIHPGVFLMETGMLRGIKHRAEAMS